MARRTKSDTPKPKRPRGRRERKAPEADVNDRTWLLRIGTRMDAVRIINGSPERPYWLSIPWGDADGNPPGAPYYPCTWFRTKTRVYYGFLMRYCRDEWFNQLEDARKELTCDVREAAKEPRV